MLPTIPLILINFLLDVTSSPVYNMQPAYITANIGTTGRNIRNLPCISRKSNQSGVCMFAIDCLKANGTHLGTCIDRFYFGSCCHVDQVHEILDNSIDSSIFPDRQPPLRLNSTERTTTVKHPERTTQKIEKITKPTIAPKTTTSIPTTRPTITTKRPTSTRIKLNSTTVAALKTEESTSRMPIVTTDSLHKLTTFQSVDGIAKDITTLKPTSYTKATTISNHKGTIKSTTVHHRTTSSPIISSTKLSTVEIPLLTKPTILKPAENISTIITTTIPSVTKLTISTAHPLKTKPTQASFISALTRLTTRPTGFVKTTTKPTQSPSFAKTTTLKSTRPSSKPTLSTKQTVKPSRTPTKRPPTTVKISPTKITKPTTKRPITTVKPITKVKSTTIRSSTTPRTKPTTQRQTTTVSVPIDTTKVSILESSIIYQSIMKRPTTEKVEVESTTFMDAPIIDIILTTAKPSVSIPTKPQIEMSTKLTTNSTSTESNEVLADISPNTSSNVTNITGNVSTNEIELIKPLVESTTKPTLVTWTAPIEQSTVNSSNTTNEDWVPITTPDGWVLLPMVSSTTSNDTIFNTSSTSSSTSTETASIPANYSTTERIPEVTSSAALIEISTQEFNITQNATDFPETTTMEDPNLFNMSDFTDVCGRRMNPKARIVGGENSSFGKWPWQISLRQWRTSTYLHKCGAALLNENWAITAAHCVDLVPPSDLLLRLGEHDLSTDSEPYLHQERRVQIVASHPQFDPRTFEYDLALLRFYEPVKFQPNILPVCVPQEDDDFIGKNAYVTGWGRLYEDGPLPSVLQEVSVPVINNTLCESMYRSAGYIEHIPHIFICAGWRRGGFDSCEGDSGGPMVIQRSDKRFLLAGVISWGIGCAEPNQPGVYTRISEFRDWINQILQF